MKKKKKLYVSVKSGMLLTPSRGRKDNEEKMELRGSLVSRDRSDRDAPGMIGLKGDKYNVGCSRGRCF